MMWQIIIKGLPVFVSFVLTFVLPYILRKKVYKLAHDDAHLADNDEELETLDYLIEWRDLIIAVLIGLFVLQFAAAGQVTSKNDTIATIALILTIAIIPLMIIGGWILADNLGLESIQSFHRFLSKDIDNQSKCKDRLPFYVVLFVMLFVILCYGLSLLFIYL